MRIHGKFGPAVLAELGVSRVEAIGGLSIEKYISPLHSFPNMPLELHLC